MLLGCVGRTRWNKALAFSTGILSSFIAQWLLCCLCQNWFLKWHRISTGRTFYQRTHPIVEHSCHQTTVLFFIHHLKIVLLKVDTTKWIQILLSNHIEKNYLHGSLSALHYTLSKVVHEIISLVSWVICLSILLNWH